MKAYQWKYVCKKCGAIHYYRPKQCQACGHLFVEKQSNMSNPKENTNDLQLQINKNKLDEEWTNQPMLYYKWAKHAAECQAKLDQAKSELEIEKAELDSDIREHPKNYGIDKLTETAISNTVASQRVYQAAVKRVQKLKHAFDIAQATVRAIEHRKSALQLLVELWIRDYYSEPQVRALTDEGEEWQKRAARKKGRERELAEADV